MSGAVLPTAVQHPTSLGGGAPTTSGSIQTIVVGVASVGRCVGVAQSLAIRHQVDTKAGPRRRGVGTRTAPSATAMEHGRLLPNKGKDH